MNMDEILEKLNIKLEDYDDLHITRNFSSFIAVSQGKIVAMTDPVMTHCPLFSMLYRSPGEGEEEIKISIRTAVESKIRQFGSFTHMRSFHYHNIAVPYGASEMMMYALRQGFIDATITVCDGAGSVITSSPSLVQGIGARMNGLFYTTPIREVLDSIKKFGGIAAFPKSAKIDQVGAVETAVQKGYKKIAVTINGFTNEDASRIIDIEKNYGVQTVKIFVCTTGISQERIEHILKYGDIIWSCASGSVREKIGSRSLLQITTGIPVFVLTQPGLRFASAYCGDPNTLQELDTDKQYLIAGYIKGKRIQMGTMTTFLSQAKLPVRSSKEPH
jgi:putative methanogenesis marker protein 8